jgi:N-acetylneuraminate synthase
MSGHSFQIGPYKLPPAAEPLVIAEAGINHNGDLGKARDLVTAAAEAGAHIVKFQTHLPDAEMLKDGFSADYIGESFYDLLNRCVIDEDGHRQLSHLASEKGILFLSTPFSREAADLLERLGVLAFKTGSGELTNLPLLKHIALKGKPMIISTGMSTLEEIKRTVDALKPINSNFVLMHCTSTYPTPYEDVRLLGIRQLQELTGVPVGLSDHSRGIATAIGAVALGAVALEKHFTLDCNWPGPDQAGSIEPDELRRLVIESKQVWLSLHQRKEVLESERPVQAMARESVVTIAAVKAGEVFTLENLWVKRPGTGISASRLNELLGRCSTRDLPANHLLAPEEVDMNS